MIVSLIIISFFLGFILIVFTFVVGSILEISMRVRWLYGEDADDNAWVEWRRSNGSRGGRARCKRAAAERILADYGWEWPRVLSLQPALYVD